MDFAEVERKLLEVYYVYRHPRTPRSARIVALITVAYLISPLDLIPEIIPFVGLLDDLLVLTLGLWYIKRNVPEDVIAEAREMARHSAADMDHWLRWAIAAMIVLVWVGVAYVLLLITNGHIILVHHLSGL